MSGLLRICTAGSVDDGKSTLIGRLLYDSRAVYEDQVASVEKASKNRVAGPIDFSLFTDGLKAEREQGITIDVAYRYFATARRKFILADTPGHEQYTRNMATGASTADVAVLLVDARNGVRTQSRRHARIARLLGINDFVLAINKMDLVDFDRGVFDGICDDFEELLRGANSHPIPISALHGDNVITQSDRTPWFKEKSLLEFLETVEVDRNASARPFRFPVQLVLRPDDAFRGYAGQIASGTVRRGDAVTILPSGRTSKVKRIVTWDGDLELAHAPMSVTLTIDDDIDVSRGDVITAGLTGPGPQSPGPGVSHERSLALSPQPFVEARFEAEVVWMDERPLDPARVYLLKQATRIVTAEVNRGLVLNQIGSVTVTTAKPMVFDRYTDNRLTGSFILIDPATNFTAGAGMITNAVEERGATLARPSAAERLARIARGAATDAEAVEAIRLALEDILT
jgi:sulfate adenylyltransferase subunit 1